MRFDKLGSHDHSQMRHSQMRRSQMRSIRGSGALYAASLGVAALIACGSPQLIPISPTEGEIARAESNGITIAVAPEGGERPVYLPTDIEPVKISIHNSSDRGIHVSLDAIELAGENLWLSPVVPQKIEPVLQASGLGLDPASPLMHPIGPVPVDLRLPTAYTAQHRQVAFGYTGFDHRRAEIVRKGFTGGFIDRGQTLEGLVYFQVPDTEVEMLELIVPIHTGQGSGAMTTITVPILLKS